ncbi:hypothetical protein GCM10010420_22560 [Streptomyces glaucosporus]|uniref:Uncharacterized protein n=1 Tax=Streptomyces glaucosporus TaxID=284044 RepID=A0ABP5V889_9ACTN
MTEPPEDSTAVVSWLTADPPAGTSRRMVIEYETLGAVAMAGSSTFPWCSDVGPAAGPGHVTRSSHLPTSTR